MHWKSSRYNHAIATTDGAGVLYNGRTGAILELSRHVFASLKSLLPPANAFLPSEAQSHPLFPHLAGGGFLIEEACDELALLEAQYQLERKRSQFLITVLPTFACNLGCEYCFVGKKHGNMSSEVQAQLVAFVEEHLAGNSCPSMSVDWFGGEPLLAKDVIRKLSAHFIRLSDQAAIPYRAQVISNGTILTDEVVAILQGSRVDRLQITLDGPMDIHDLRRPYKSGRKSSFSQIVGSLPSAIGKFLIRLRINVDARNLHSVWELLELFVEKGWIGNESRFFPYLARVSPFTDACSGVSNKVCSMEEFYRVQFRWMQKLEELGIAVGAQGLYQFPEPKLYNCGAVGANGFVFTPEGEIHKCGLTVDDSTEAVGHLRDHGLVSKTKLQKWDNYSPFDNPVCRSCEFLPTCLGGCPRNQMESRTVQLKENCTYHMKYENQIVLFHLGHRNGLDMVGDMEMQKRTASPFRILQ
jgi:uncharacterized protein